MKKIIFILFCALLLISCSYEVKRNVRVSLYSYLSWEEETGDEMWFSVRYFDGNEVETAYLSAGERAITLSVSPSSLSVFVFYPLGSLAPLGGFWEPGNEMTIYVEPQYGYFAQMLVDAAETMREAVRELSINAIKKDNPDLGALKREDFLLSLYSGTLSKKAAKLSKRFAVPLEGVLSGYWISLFSHSYSFTLNRGGDERELYLLPGIWYYLNKERSLILEIVITDDGEYWVKHKSKPKW